jgi:hypothetical protein
MALEFPQYASATLSQSASSTGGAATAFGFRARWLKFLNTESVDWWVNLKSTSASGASTADMRIRACSEVVMPNLPQIAGLAGYTTSTAAAAKLLYVTALADPTA